MSGLFFQSKKKSTTLLLDVGSASVSVGLLVEAPGELPVLADQTIEYLAVSEKGSGEQEFFTSLKQALRKSLNRFTGQVGKMQTRYKLAAPDRVIAVFSSPWYAVEVKKIEQNFEGQHEISEEYVQSLKDHLVKDFRKNANSMFLDYFRKDGVSVTSSVYLATELNGYSTSTPIGQTAQSFGATVFLSALPTSLKEVVDSAVGEYFHTDHLEYVSQPFLFCSTFPNLFADLDGTVIFTRVAGERTELTVLNNGIISDIYSFGLGENDLTRQVAQTMGIGLESARSLFSITKRRELEDAEERKLLEAVKPMLGEWQKQFQEGVRVMSHVGSVGAADNVVLARGELSSLFRQVLENTQGGPENSKQVIEFSAHRVSNQLQLRPQVRFDPSLILAAAYGSG